jgi:hypothetical protein
MLLASRILQQHLTNVTAAGGSPGTLFQQRQLVFLALAGEPWGYMGSKRLLWELSQGSAAVAGLQWQLVDQVGRGACYRAMHKQRSNLLQRVLHFAQCCWQRSAHNNKAIDQPGSLMVHCVDSESARPAHKSWLMRASSTAGTHCTHTLILVYSLFWAAAASATWPCILTCLLWPWSRWWSWVPWAAAGKVAAATHARCTPIGSSRRTLAMLHR